MEAPLWHLLCLWPNYVVFREERLLGDREYDRREEERTEKRGHGCRRDLENISERERRRRSRLGLGDQVEDDREEIVIGFGLILFKSESSSTWPSLLKYNSNPLFYVLSVLSHLQPDPKPKTPRLALWHSLALFVWYLPVSCPLSGAISLHCDFSSVIFGLASLFSTLSVWALSSHLRAALALLDSPQSCINSFFYFLVSSLKETMMMRAYTFK